MRKVTGMLLAALMLCTLVACKNDNADNTTPTTPTVTVDTTDAAALTEEDRNDAPDLQGATTVTLADDGITVNGDGVTTSGTVATVTAGGTYVVSGSLTDGQLRVESEDAQTVNLVLNGVEIHSKTTAPLFIRSSEKTVITLTKGTTNRLSDSAEAVFEDVENEEPSGALFSKSDLTINGDGTLEVTADFRDGIVSRDGLKLAGGHVTVTAADDAVMGRDYVLIGGGDYTLRAVGDGIKSTNDADTTVGFIRMEGGTVTITSDKDGVQAQSSIEMNGGTLNVTAGGGSQNGTANMNFDFGWGAQSTDSENVGKGLKAGSVIVMRDGVTTVDAADDALHSNQTITIQNGTITAAAGDDGIHADTSVTISGGEVTVTKSYEALEAATIAVDGGTVSLTASDDGVNASSGTSGSTGDPGGQDPFASDDSLFTINGGTLYVDAGGDGLDSNGTIEMNGGTVTVCGPSNSGNGTFDFGAAFNIHGGTLIGIGSMGMAQNPSTNEQQSIVWGGCSLQSGDTLTVTDASGETVASIVSVRTAQWAYITSPDLKEGETYTLKAGTVTQSVTLQGGMNTIGTASGGMMGGPGGMGGHGNPGGMGGHGGMGVPPGGF